MNRGLFVVWLLVSISFMFSFNFDVLELRGNLWIQMIFSAFIISSAGAVLQIVIQNPLADPWILGVSGASNLASVLAGYLTWSPILFWRTGMSFVGAMATLFVLMKISYRAFSFDHTKFILIGIGINSFTAAFIVLLQGIIAPNDFFASWVRLSGYFAQRTVYELAVLIFSALIMLIFLIKRQKELQILQTGEDLSYSIGINTHQIKKEALLVCAFSLSVVISLTGSIAFLGLIVPHIIRIIFTNRKILDPAYLFFISGIFLINASLIIRLLPEGIFVPVGVMMSFIGAPFFIYLLMKSFTNNSH